MSTVPLRRAEKKVRRQRQADAANSSLVLLEQVLPLLRSLPMRAWRSYLAATLPFIGGLLLFWSAMRRDPFASDQLAVNSLLLAVSFIWMRFHLTRFGAHLRAATSGTFHLAPATRRLKQTLIHQPWSLIVLPLAAVIGLPYPAALAYYSHFLVFDDADGVPLAKQAREISGQEWKSSSLYALGWLPVLFLFLFINAMVLIALIPELLGRLFGFQSVLLKNPFAILNGTSAYAAMLFSYLLITPVNLAYFYLRGYEIQARRSGIDILHALRRFSAVLVILFAGIFLGPSTAPAAPLDTAQQVSRSEQLETGLREVRSQRKYLWRYPPELLDAHPDASLWRQELRGFLQPFFDWVEDTTTKIADWITKWLIRRSSRSGFHAPDPSNILGVIKVLILGLIGVLSLLVIGLLVRTLHRRTRAAQAMQGAGGDTKAKTDEPDIREESVLASDLPHARWLEKAREFYQTGELRLASRALFLASLALLADRRLVHILRSKSNRDYEREIGTRAHAAVGSLERFRALRTLFEAAWYGNHSPSREQLDRAFDLMDQEQAAAQ